MAIKWTYCSDIVTNFYGESWELKFSRIFTLVKINKAHRKQQGQEAKTTNIYIGMNITTWIELKSVHRLVFHLDHLNHCPICHKNEVTQMKQTVRFGAIKNINVFGKIQHLRARVPNKFLAILDLTYLKLGKIGARFRIESMLGRWVPKITLGII